MWIPDFVLKLAGKKIAKTLNLQEKPVDNKKWYQSKTVWGGVVTVLSGAYELVRANLAPQLPPIPAWLFTILGAIGVYGRVTASSTIEK